MPTKTQGPRRRKSDTSARVPSEVFGATIHLNAFHTLPRPVDAPTDRANGFRVEVERDSEGTSAVTLTRVLSEPTCEHVVLELYAFHDELPVVLELLAWCCAQLQRIPQAQALLPLATGGQV